jgi:hypothetical protein
MRKVRHRTPACCLSRASRLLQVSRTADAMSWEAHSISAAHNRGLVPNASRTNGSTPLPWWASHAGALLGDNLPGWGPRTSTLADAEAACDGREGCIGLTYHSNVTAPTAALPVFLKGGGAGNADANWTSFYKPAHIQPFDARVNSSSWPPQSTAYTSLERTGPRSAVLIYDQWLHHMGNTWRVYAMTIELQ